MTRVKSSANVVDGKLILSFPGAVTPVVWQMDLNEAKASALEIIEDDGSVSLVLKTPRGETVNVASFESRKTALNGLMAVSKALENAHGQIRGGASAPQDNQVGGTSPSAEARGMSGWMAGLVGVALVVVLITIWSAVAPKPEGVASLNATSTASGGSQSNVGVPLSADEYLRGQ